MLKKFKVFLFNHEIKAGQILKSCFIIVNNAKCKLTCKVVFHLLCYGSATFLVIVADFRRYKRFN